MKKAVYAGSFDPVTLGHQDIIERASKLCDKLIIVVMINSKKKYWFSLEERQNMIKEIFKDNEKVEVKYYDGALVNFMKEEGVELLIKGLRNYSDFEAELVYANANNEFSGGKIETIFLPARPEYGFISSSFVKEACIYNLNLEKFLSNKISNLVLERAKKFR